MADSRHRSSIVVLALWTVACGPEGGDEDVASEQDEQACSDGSWLRLECPAGYAPQLHVGFEGTVLDLGEVAISMCGGQGVFVDGDAVEGYDLAGFEIVRNSYCTFGCFGGCGTGKNECAAKRPAGDACARVCSDIDAEGCEEFVRGCQEDGDDAAAEDDACGPSE